jgi:peptidoglycan L-alanyl-D-glutamate endopeptidase CwlK
MAYDRLLEPELARSGSAFGRRSLAALFNVHPLLRAVADEAIKRIDFTVVCGHRDKRAQEQAFRDGTSRARFGESPHNYLPALAFDAYLYPIDVDSVQRCKILAPVILDAARYVNVDIEWGGTWKSFKDWPHFQLRNWRQYL